MTTQDKNPPRIGSRMKASLFAAGIVASALITTSMPTATAFGWADEFAAWRDCLLDNASIPISPHPDPCLPEFHDFLDAARQEPVPECITVNKSKLMDGDPSGVERRPCGPNDLPVNVVE